MRGRKEVGNEMAVMSRWNTGNMYIGIGVRKYGPKES